MLIKYGFGICELLCLCIDHGLWHFWELVEHRKELRRHEVSWLTLLCSQMEESGPLAMPQCGKGSTGRVLWLPSPGVCFWPSDLGALVAPWLYPCSDREKITIIR